MVVSVETRLGYIAPRYSTGRTVLKGYKESVAIQTLYVDGIGGDEKGGMKDVTGGGEDLMGSDEKRRMVTIKWGDDEKAR